MPGGMGRAERLIELLRLTPRGYLIQDALTGTASLYDREPTLANPRVALMTARFADLAPAIRRGVIVRTRGDRVFARYDLCERVVH